MAGILPDRINDVEAIEDFQTSTLDTVGMTGSDACIAFIYHTCLDAATSHPQSSHKAELKRSQKGFLPD